MKKYKVNSFNLLLNYLTESKGLKRKLKVVTYCVEKTQ